MRTVYLTVAIVLTAMLHLSVAAIVVGVGYLAVLAFRDANFFGAIMLTWLELWMLWSLLSVRTQEQGIRKERSEVPALYALIDEVAERIRTRAPDAVYLVPDASVSVEETAGILGLPLRSRRVVIIGLAALQGLTMDQLRVILAHELAHFRQGDTALGQFIRRAVLSLVATLDAIRSRTWWWFLNPTYWYLRGFAEVHIAVISALDRTQRRQQEFRADLLAAQTCGAEVARSMLVEIAINQRIFEQITQIAVDTVQVGPLPNMHAMHREHRERMPRATREQLIQQAMDSQPEDDDSHPTLRERLQAIEACGPAPAHEPDDRPAASVFPDPEAIEIEQSRLMEDALRYAIYVELDPEIMRMVERGSAEAKPRRIVIGDRPS